MAVTPPSHMTQFGFYSSHSKHVANGLNCFVQLLLPDAQAGALRGLTLQDFVAFSSMCRAAHICSRSIWKNLLTHQNSDYLRTDTLTKIHPASFKVIYLQLHQFQLSLATPHLIREIGQRGCTELKSLLSANQNTFYHTAIEGEDSDSDLDTTATEDHLGEKMTGTPMPPRTAHADFVRVLGKWLKSAKCREVYEGWGPITLAARSGDAYVMQTFFKKTYQPIPADDIAKKICIESQDENNGYTALMYAARRGHLEAARVLIEENASPNTGGGHKGITPLQEAIDHGRTAVVAFLLQNRADPNQRDQNRKTPLMYAAENGELASVELLLEYKAKIKSKDSDGLTASTYALIMQNKFDTEDKAMRDDHPYKQEIHAAAIAHTKILDVLLRCLKDLEATEAPVIHVNKKRKHKET